MKGAKGGEFEEYEGTEEGRGALWISDFNFRAMGNVKVPMYMLGQLNQ